MVNKIAEEKFIYKPALKEKDSIPIWWCYPSNYTIGMTSLGYLSLFKILDQCKDIYPERIFINTKKTVHNIKKVELASFSMSFELDYTGIFKILNQYNIPFRASDRTEDHPLIFGGGPVLTANPEPYADFFDFITLGEGEETLPEIIAAYKEVRYIKNKREKLIRISQVPGVYVPSLYDVEYNPDNTIKSFIKNIPDASATIFKRHTKDLSKCVYSPILTEKSMFSNMFLIETARGCPKMCRFCIASYLTLPARYPDYSDIITIIDKGLEYSDKIGLLGALITEHPCFDKILEYISAKRKEKKFELSVASLRADKITPLAVKTLVECGQRQVTIAIEAGSKRLRKFINKHLSEEDIIDSVKNIKNNGILELKIYAIIGLPTETNQDIADLAAFMTKLKKDNKQLALTLSVSSFVPKANTPFQWDKRERNSSLQEKTNYLKKELAKVGVLFKPTSIKWDYIQAVLSMGDRRLSPILEKVFEYGNSLGSWNRSYKEIIEENGFLIPELDWYAHREKAYDEILAWDFINIGLNKDFLESERKKAYKSK